MQRVVSSKAFDTVWVDANRRAHSALDKALTGNATGAVSAKNGQVTIDVAPIVAQVKDRLVSAGFKPAARIPAVHGLRGVRVEGHRQDQDVSAGAGHHRRLAPRHRRAHRRRGRVPGHRPSPGPDRGRAGVFAAMVVLGIVLAVARAVYLDHLPVGTSEDAAATVFDSWSGSCAPVFARSARSRS